MCSDLIYVGEAERESGRILVVYNISYMLATIHHTLILLNFCRLWYVANYYCSIIL